MSRYSSGKFLGVLVTLVSVCTLGLGAPPAAGTQEKLDVTAAGRGEDIFLVYCTSCHGRSATGDGPLAPDLKVKPANLTELSQNNDGKFPWDMVIKTIEHGRHVRGHGSEDMPAWGDAFEMTSQSEAEAKAKMSDLANYLWSLQPRE